MVKISAGLANRRRMVTGYSRRLRVGVEGGRSKGSLAAEGCEEDRKALRASSAGSSLALEGVTFLVFPGAGLCSFALLSFVLSCMIRSGLGYKATKVGKLAKPRSQASMEPGGYAHISGCHTFAYARRTYISILRACIHNH